MADGFEHWSDWPGKNHISLALSDARRALQLRLIDNGGWRSPQTLIPGLDHLAIGQDMMTMFSLVAFSRNAHLTILIKPNTRAERTFARIAVSYLIAPRDNVSCRLLVKLLVQHRQGIAGVLMRTLLPWGDLIMMRKQLLNFKKLAETSR